MRVIGAGLPRTGTLTQKLALEQLGVGPCYHWVNVIADLDQVELWWRSLDGEDAWREALEGFTCTVDWPGGYFYRELDSPSKRDAPTSWPGRPRPRAAHASYLRILMMRSMPSLVCSRPSWVSMKQACTYQPGLAVIVSCW